MHVRWPRRLRRGVALCAVWLPVFGSTAWFGAPVRAQDALSLEQAVAAASGRSLQLLAADVQARAARELVGAAGQLPDPVLKLGLANLPIDGPDRFSVTRDSMTMRTVGVMQEITRSDKLRARGVRAEREVAMAQVARQAALVQVQRDAALAWLECSLQDSARELVRSQMAQAELQLQAAETVFRSGKGSHAEVLAARGALEQVRDSLAQVERQRALARVQLERWVGATPANPLAARPVLQLPAWTQGDLAASLAKHPQIAAAEVQTALADSEAALARAARRADWSVELMLGQRGPAYSSMVSINFSLPLQWNAPQRQDRELAARTAGTEAARARRDDLQRAQEAEVGAMLVQWRSHEQRLARFDTALLPLAAQRSEAALVAYRAGGSGLPSVLEARRDELSLRLERLRLEAEHARIWAQLRYLLPASPEAEAGGVPQ